MNTWADLDLDAMQRTGDPLADNTVAAVLGPWDAIDMAERSSRIAAMNRLIGEWQTNGALEGWTGQGDGVAPEMSAALRTFVRAARAMPSWADPARIARAESLFIAQGPLSCVLLFCSSLPECYVVPDLAAVLHVAGQLERHTDYRVRSTAAMIFPVMMAGGLLTPGGSGVAQVLKVRLIHATIRHLILHGDPQQARGVVKGVAVDRAGASMHLALAGVGWDVDACGVPCNQEELAYTLLTFSRCFLQGLRRLRLAVPEADEEAYLHTWNVVGHVLGIRRELMAYTMGYADTLFATMQQRGRAEPRRPDPRPPLAAALMNAMAEALPLAVVRPWPALLTRHLCGRQTSNDLALSWHASWLSRGLFALGMALTAGIDAVARQVWPQFSLSRWLTRILGYHLVMRLLMDETRPLQLPDEVLNQMRGVVAGWGDDPKAPRWLNVMEDRFTAPGPWQSGVRR